MLSPVKYDLVNQDMSKLIIHRSDCLRVFSGFTNFTAKLNNYAPPPSPHPLQLKYVIAETLMGKKKANILFPLEI